jgi:hypothetical protein
MRKLAAAIALISLSVLMLGCSDEDEPDLYPTPTAATASPVPTGPTSDDLTRAQSAEVQDLIARLRGAKAFHVRGQVDLDESLQSSEFTVSSTDSSFFGEIITESEGVSQELSIIRANKLTWLKADAGFWAENGYDAESASRAQGLYVVFEPQAGDDIAASHDPLVLIDYLINIDLKDVHPLISDGSSVYAFGPGVVVDINGESEVQVVSEAEDSRVTVNYALLSEPVKVEVPLRDETLIVQ